MVYDYAAPPSITDTSYQAPRQIRVTKVSSDTFRIDIDTTYFAVVLAYKGNAYYMNTVRDRGASMSREIIFFPDKDSLFVGDEIIMVSDGAVRYPPSPGHHVKHDRHFTGRKVH